MADLDNFTRDVAAGIMPPDFDDLVRVSRRRRRTQVVRGGAAVLALVGVAAYGAQGLTGEDATPAQPAPTASGPTQDRQTTPGETIPTQPQPMTAEEIVLDPDSFLAAFAASGIDHDVRVSVWRCAPQPGCRDGRAAIALTDDGFRTHRVLDLPRGANLSALGLDDGSFLVGDAPRGVLVRDDGSTLELTVDDRPGPLEERELVVPYWASPGQQSSGALDPETGRVHPLSVPEGTVGPLHGGIGSPLWGLAARETTGERRWYAVVSRDQGASWSEHELGASADDLALAIESADPTVMAVVAGGDGATLFPFDKVLRSNDDGTTWESTMLARAEDTAYVSFSAVLPDGSLLVNLDAWSDDRIGAPGDAYHGLYRSDGTDWGDLTPVESSYPEGTDLEVIRTDPPTIVDWSVAHNGEAVLWGWAPGINTPMMVSTDSGETWTESAGR